MDIEKLKNDYIEKKNMQEEIERIRNITLYNFDKLISIDLKVRNECKKVYFKSILKFKEEFNNYFNKSGFKVFDGNPTIAKLNELEVTLLKLESKEDEAKYRLNIASEKEYYIELRISDKVNDAMCWEFDLDDKANLVIDKKNGRATIHSCTDINELKKINSLLFQRRKKLINLLNEDELDLYKYAFNEFTSDELDLKDKEEYNTFEELFKLL